MAQSSKNKNTNTNKSNNQNKSKKSNSSKPKTSYNKKSSNKNHSNKKQNNSYRKTNVKGSNKQTNKPKTSNQTNKNLAKKEPQTNIEKAPLELEISKKNLISEAKIKKTNLSHESLIIKEEPKKDDTKPVKAKKISSLLYLIIFILYIEVVVKLVAFKSLSGICTTFLFSIPFIFLLYLILNIFKEKGNKILCYIITIVLSFFYGFHCVFFRLFSNIFSFNTISLASDIGEFKSMIFTTIAGNIVTIILYIIPIIFLIIFRNKIEFKRASSKKIILSISLCLFSYLLCILSLFLNKSDTYSAYNLYYNINSEIKNVEKFGIATTTRLDIKRIIFGFEEKLTTESIPDPNPEEPNIPEEPQYNQIEINFDELIEKEQNATIKSILSYFKNSKASNKNEYTGMFKDKNLIFILAEGFNTIAVDKNLTPTLYKLTHEGFVFNNYYSPVFLSTTGGEFQASTGLIPTQETLSNWKKYMPTIKYALGVSFSNIGYKTQSYHNWTYTYYKRDNTMPTLGFKNYLGCGNGLEDLMNCAWLPSDIEMINATLPFYKNESKFATYYVTVSGHAPYVYNSSGNSIALKNIDAVESLPYSDNVKAYLATQIEFDRALEALIKSLDEEGILDDTVISFVGDHYPYTLTLDEINELSSYERDETVEVNRSNFVIWNNKIEHPIIVDKVGSQIDVLPTLLNLFGIEFDSRLIIGKDILSNNPGLAIFSNRSWVSDYGTYQNGVLTLKENKSLPNELEYIKSVNNIVANRFTISNQIIKYNMYEYLFD